MILGTDYTKAALRGSMVLVCFLLCNFCVFIDLCLCDCQFLDVSPTGFAHTVCSVSKHSFLPSKNSFRLIARRLGLVVVNNDQSRF